MEESFLLFIALSLLTLIALKFLFKSRRKPGNLPPSPPGIPILGHLHLLKPPVHRSLLSLSQKYGPIISLRFGSKLVVVVSSPSIAEECFTKNDVVFANRPDFTVSRYLSYNNTTLGASPYGDHWRKLRRVSALEILSSNRLNLSLNIRRDEVQRMLKKIYGVSSRDFAEVELKTKFKEITLNVTMRIVAGKRYYGEDAVVDEETKKFRQLIEELFEFTLSNYPSDFLPILKWIETIQGYNRRAEKLIKRIDNFWQGLIDEFRNGKDVQREERQNCMVAHLLVLQKEQPEYYTEDILKGLILTMILGGTDTSSVTIEWAMANLINHPRVMERARAEIEDKVEAGKLIEESDLPKLSYLKCIVLETLRLYPAGPLLLPHRSSADCTLSGYDVPAETILLVNAWAIHRDPKVWEDSTTFKPERFENPESEAHKLMIAFGLGRRSCPGVGMAHRVLGLTLGSLIQCFEWKKIGEKEIDMAEGKGISMPKALPLEALCKARPIGHAIICRD